MLYINKSLLESLGQICNGKIPAGYNKKPVYVRIGDKVFKYGTGSFSFVTLMALTACGGRRRWRRWRRHRRCGLERSTQGAVAFIDLNNNAKLDIASEPCVHRCGRRVQHRFYSKWNGGHYYGRYRDVVGGTLSINAGHVFWFALTGVTLRRQRVRPLFHPHQQLFNHYQRRVSQLPKCVRSRLDWRWYT